MYTLLSSTRVLLIIEVPVNDITPEVAVNVLFAITELLAVEIRIPDSVELNELLRTVILSLPVVMLIETPNVLKNLLFLRLAFCAPATITGSVHE